MIYAAIIGTGNIAPAHIQGLLTFPERVKITALCDIYPEKAERIRDRFALDADVYNDAAQMLAAHPEISEVHVCTPPYTHASIAILCMKAGRNVVTEKPMATCLKECDEMLAVQKETGVMLACIAQNRWRDDVWKLKKVLESGIAGKIVSIQVNSAWWRAHSYYDLWWRGTWEKEGGGPTLNHAVHHIDMLNWIQGCMPDQVTAMYTNVCHDNSEVEDLSMSIMKYPDHSLASVLASVVHHGEEQGIVVQCREAKLAFPWSVWADRGKPNGFYEEGGDPDKIAQIQKVYDAIPDQPYQGHTAEIDNVLTTLEQGNEPLVTGLDGRRTVELITAIYKAASLEETIRLPITQEDEFYTTDGILRHAVRFYEKSQAVENFAEDTITT